MNWKKCSGVLCDKRMPVKLKGKVYRTVVRPAMLYGAETWATAKRQGSRIEVNEMSMLRWMCGVKRKRQNQERTHPRNDESSAGVQKDNGEKTEMVWARHEDGRRSRSAESDDESDTGERMRGRPKARWKDVCKKDMQTVGMREGYGGDRAYWKGAINNHSGDPK